MLERKISLSKEPTVINAYQLSKINAASSYLTAILSGTFFHPFDRALFLAIANKRRYFFKANFVQPFHGIGQTLIYKQMTGGAYFFAQAELDQKLSPVLKRSGYGPTSTELCIGILAGGFDGAVKNTPTAIRANTWQYGGTFTQAISRMWKNGGIQPFISGLYSTILRDAVFGATYEITRRKLRDLPPKKNVATAFACDTVAGAAATIVAGPVNYARVMQHRVLPGDKIPSIIECVCSLFKDATQVHSTYGKLQFFQQRLGINASTVRVAVGMGVTQFFADWLKAQIHHSVTDPEPSVIGNTAKRLIG